MLTTLARFVINAALALDMGANVLLLGRPGETISRRIARLRAYGGRWSPVGCVLCAALKKAFWFMRRDHCTWALDPTDQIDSGWELWRWSK